MSDPSLPGTPDGGVSPPPLKRCPDCAEMVQQDARICRFCRYDFEQATRGETASSTLDATTTMSQSTSAEPAASAAESPPAGGVPAVENAHGGASGSALPSRPGGFKNWWQGLGASGRRAIVVVAAVTGVVAIGAAIDSGSRGDSTSSSANVVNETPVGDQGDSSSASSDASTAVSGRVNGTFDRDCLLCDRTLASYIRTSDVWCGWKDGKVMVHVSMTNESVEHITVNWHPAYTIAGGGEHGAGLTSVESDGFDSGEVRSLTSEQDPEGVSEGSPISECRPSFSVIESG